MLQRAPVAARLTLGNAWPGTAHEPLQGRLSRPRLDAGRLDRKTAHADAAKTQRPVQFEVTDKSRVALDLWLSKRGLPPWRFSDHQPDKARGASSTRRYARIVHSWVRSIGLEVCRFDTHSMKRTNATLIYKATKIIRAVQ